MIAKIIELFPATLVHLTLEDFCCDKTFIQLSQKRRALKLSFRCDSQEIAGKAGVTPIDFRRFDESLAKVFEVRRNNDDLGRDFENVQPLAYGRHRNPERCGKIWMISSACRKTRILRIEFCAAMGIEFRPSLGRPFGSATVGEFCATRPARIRLSISKTNRSKLAATCATRTPESMLVDAELQLPRVITILYGDS
jgi:hypothetical protein